MRIDLAFQSIKIGFFEIFFDVQFLFQFVLFALVDFIGINENQPIDCDKKEVTIINETFFQNFTFNIHLAKINIHNQSIEIE